MIRTQTQAGPLYQSKKLLNLGWIGHGFGTKGISLDEYLHSFGHKLKANVRTRQIHSSKVHVLNDETPLLLEGDAFITARKGAVCFVRTADCVPVLLCDDDKRVIAAVHAGWRGMTKRIISNTIRKMISDFDCKSEDLAAAIGPSICNKCYTVGEEVVTAFKDNGFSSELWKLKDKLFNLDLSGAAKEDLIYSGVMKEKIVSLPLCTCCVEDEFVSYRKNKKEKSRQINFIYII